MKNSLLAIFDEIWPCTTLARFRTTLKIHKKSNFDRNQFKILKL